MRITRLIVIFLIAGGVLSACGPRLDYHRGDVIKFVAQSGDIYRFSDDLGNERDFSCVFLRPDLQLKFGETYKVFSLMDTVDKDLCLDLVAPNEPVANTILSDIFDIFLLIVVAVSLFFLIRFARSSRRSS